MKKLYQIVGFLPFTVIIFLNAFVDLGHKIIIQNTIFKIYDGETQIILTAIVNALILLPFILLFSPTGFISDRYRKPTVMRISALAAIPLTLIITYCYYQGLFDVAFVMTYLLAVQSTFFSPAKFGYIKELVGQKRLAPMNAVVQSITMVSILLGIFFFSVLFENALQNQLYNNEADILHIIAPLGWVLFGCATIEAILAFRLPITPATSSMLKSQQKRFVLNDYARGQYLKSNLLRLRGNRNIWLSIIGLSIFWGISQVVLATFPAHAKHVLNVNNTVVIQGMLACAGIGIVLGSLIAGRLSKQYIETGLVAIGAIGVVASLFMMTQLYSIIWLSLDILAIGFFGGMFIVPLNSIIQFQAPEHHLGTILAGNNWIQNIVMFCFLLLTVGFSFTGLNSIGLFNAITVIAFLGAIYTIYRLPQSLVRIMVSGLFATRYRISVHGFEHLPAQGGVLMLGNHISFLDWAMIQIACPRPVRFVMHKDYYHVWYLKWFLDFFGVIPIASGESKQALEQINTLLKADEVVCLFPEGAISRNGQMGVFKRGYENTVADVDGVILPFYIHGLFGSRFSGHSVNEKILRYRGHRRDVIVVFGKPLPVDIKATELRDRVADLSIHMWHQDTAALQTNPHARIQTENNN